MKAMPLIITGILSIGLAACQGSESPKTPAPAPSETMAPAQPAGNEVRDVKQPETSPMAAMESNTEAPAANQMMAQMQQEPAKMAESTAKPVTTTQAAPVAPAPETAAPAPAAKPATEAAKQVASSLPIGNAANGEKLAGKCKACHNFNDKKKVGPGLAGVVGRKAGTEAGMSYSDSLKSANWVWDAKHLAPWVCDSAAAVKEFTGNAAATTKMPGLHICDPQQQADLIAFLKTL